MPNLYRLQVKKTEQQLEDESGALAERPPLTPVEQPWYPRIVAGNGIEVFTGAMMHNRSDAAAALAKLVMAIQAHEFRYEFPDG